MFSPDSQYHLPPAQNESSQNNKANLKNWWNHFNFVQKTKKDVYEAQYKAHDTAEHPVFGKPLKDSLRYASVQISTANANGDLYVWGYIPVVVAKCGLYLKENATEIPGTFRVNGSNKRMRDLQAAFEAPPRYGKSLDWKQEMYTPHDVASVFRRYLTQMPEPVIPHDMYHLFRDALAKRPFNQEEIIATYKSLIRRMPRPNQYLLLYVLDLLSVFARKSDKNLMTSTNLAVIFRPGLISHPKHEMSPQEHALSQQVLEFLIAHQDWFMLDIVPPPPVGDFPGDEGFGGGYGGPSQGGSGGGGPPPGSGGGGAGGKWREGSSTPTRQNTSDSMWNSEAGPSSTRTTTRQRIISGGPDIGTWHAYGGNGAGSSPRTVGTWAAQVQPQQTQRSDRRMSGQQHPYLSQQQSSQPPQPQSPQQRNLVPQQHNSYFPNTSASKSNPSPVNLNANSHSYLGPPERDGQGSAHGHLNESAPPSAFVTPMSSLPPSPASSGSSHRHRQHSQSQQQQYPQQPIPPPGQRNAYPPPSSPTKVAFPEPQARAAYSNAQAVNVQPSHAQFANGEPQSQLGASSFIPIRTASPLETSLHNSQPRSPQYQSHPQSQTGGTRPHPIRTGSSSQNTMHRQQHVGHVRAASSPLPSPISTEPLGSGLSDIDDVMVVPEHGEESSNLSGGWKFMSPQGQASGNFVGSGYNTDEPSKREKAARGKEKEERTKLRMMRRRTTMDRNELVPSDKSDMSPIRETPSSSEQGYGIGNGYVSVTRSRTLPSRRKAGDAYDDKENSVTDKENPGGNPGLLYGISANDRTRAKEKNGKNKDKEPGERKVLKKQRRASAATAKSITISVPNGIDLGRT